MRSALGICGTLGTVAIIALAGIYGFRTTDDPLMGYAVAFVYGFIALGGIAGPAVVVHLGKRLNGWAKAWTVPVAIVVLGAALGNLSNSLGALVTRADKTTAERSKTADTTKDDRARLAAVERERWGMTFAATTAEAAKAAQDAVASAESKRIAECGTNNEKRGLRCRDRETDETAARTAATQAIGAKALTNHAAALDKEAAEIRARLAEAPAVRAINPLAEALERILKVPAADAATWRDFFLVAIVEMLVATALAAFEALAPIRQPETKADLIVPAPAERSSVARFMLACLPRSNGSEVAWGLIYARYRSWCEAQQIAPLDLPAFGEEFRSRCERVGIEVQRKGNRVLCRDVALVA